jgi:hypothetical protein
MDHRNGADQELLGRPRGYKAYLRSRGRLAIPRSSAYRYMRRDRDQLNDRPVCVQPNARQADDGNEPPPEVSVQT